jgi:SAM-dependent methyltransferase
MTPQCQEWIGRCVRLNPEIKGSVLEVGSFDVCGNPRYHFADQTRFPYYVGIDMREGPCVDQVMNCHDLDFPTASFGVVVDAERLEHDCDFMQSYREISRIIRPGGHVIITTRSWGGFGPHDYPSDYWRFMDNGLKYILETSGFECLKTEYGENRGHGDSAVFALGRKK